MPGPQQLIVIAIVALLVFGPERLPEFARMAARGLAKVRNEAAKNIGELREITEFGEIEREFNDIRGQVTGTRNQLRRTLLADDQGTHRRADASAGGVRPDDRPPPTDLEAT